MSEISLSIESDGTLELSQPVINQIIEAISPDVTLSRITGGANITIVDKDGSHSVDVYDGTNGTDGADGADGADGYSPTVTVESVTGGKKVTITDANGDHEFTITNGTNGSNGANAYVHIKYAASEPSADSDMKDTADAWMGIYSGTASSAPAHYTSYTWYNIKGSAGDPTALIDDNATSGSAKTWSVNKLKNELDKKANKSIVAEEYSTSKTYYSNDYAIHNGKLYRCVSSTSGSWVASKWLEVTVADRLKSLLTADGTTRSYIDTLTAAIATAFSTASTYAVGDYVTKDNKLYVCSTAVTTAGAWDSSDWTEIKVSEELTSLKSAINGKYTKPENGIPASDLASGVIPSVPVTDVQINGSSILSSGVANVPISADYNTFGVTKAQQYGGLQYDNTTHALKIASAGSSHIKSASSNPYPIIPSTQHESVFYGLAKASGDTSQSSSSNAVGTYTADALVKIQKMLGVYEAPWELIREDTVTNATEADIDITVDGDGNAFELTDVRMMLESPQQETEFVKGDYGRIGVYYSSTGSYSLYIGAYTQAANASKRYSHISLTQKDGCVEKTFITNCGSGSITDQIRTVGGREDGPYDYASKNFTKIKITSVKGTLHYKLYGKRKWT